MIHYRLLQRSRKGVCCHAGSVHSIASLCKRSMYRVNTLRYLLLPASLLPSSPR